MVAALENGATVVGAAPGYDTDPAAQIRWVFELARRYGLDIDMHLASGDTAEHLDLRWCATWRSNKVGRGGWRSATRPSSR